jgi:hypothetical protein
VGVDPQAYMRRAVDAALAEPGTITFPEVLAAAPAA